MACRSLRIDAPRLLSGLEAGGEASLAAVAERSRRLVPRGSAAFAVLLREIRACRANACRFRVTESFTGLRPDPYSGSPLGADADLSSFQGRKVLRLVRTAKRLFWRGAAQPERHRDARRFRPASCRNRGAGWHCARDRCGDDLRLGGVASFPRPARLPQQ